MKKQIARSILAMLLILSMTWSYSLVALAEEEEEEKPLDMAYNIYSNPQFGDMERKFETFTIDMRATLTPYCTYWSLANFNMHISDLTRKEYPDIRAGGAYAGLQNTDAVGGRKAIMSFWEWHYWPDGYKSGVEETNLVAERIYPSGSSQFGGEGEGTNYIRNYPWRDNVWYRMVLHTWTDPIRGTTYCGQWVADLSTGKWTLISYFDTKMRESYLEGDMSFFMENFVGTTAGEERDVHLKNLYIKHYDTKEWMSIDSTRLRHCNDWANNKTGKHSFGATEEYFWGKSGGFLEEGVDQDQYDDEWPAQVFTIQQPEQPTFGTVGIEEIRLAKKEGEWYARWIMKTDSTPQFWYRMDIRDENGEMLYTNQATKPEAFYEMLDHIKTDVFTCTVTVKDIFGNTTSFTQGTEKYEELYGQKTETPIVDKDNDGGNNLGLIIGISAGVVGVIAIAGVWVMVAMKAKKKKN